MAENNPTPSKPANQGGNPSPKPDSNPANVREPSNTRPPGDPTPDKTPRPQSGKQHEEEPDVNGE